MRKHDIRPPVRHSTTAVPYHCRPTWPGVLELGPSFECWIRRGCGDTGNETTVQHNASTVANSRRADQRAVMPVPALHCHATFSRSGNCPEPTALAAQVVYCIHMGTPPNVKQTGKNISLKGSSDCLLRMTLLLARCAAHCAAQTRACETGVHRAEKRTTTHASRTRPDRIMPEPASSAALPNTRECPRACAVQCSAVHVNKHGITPSVCDSPFTESSPLRRHSRSNSQTLSSRARRRSRCPPWGGPRCGCGLRKSSLSAYRSAWAACIWSDSKRLFLASKLRRRDKLIKGAARKKNLHSPLLHDVMMQSSSNPSQHSGCSSTAFACNLPLANRDLLHQHASLNSP